MQSNVPTKLKEATSSLFTAASTGTGSGNQSSTLDQPLILTSNFNLHIFKNVTHFFNQNFQKYSLTLCCTSLPRWFRRPSYPQPWTGGRRPAARRSPRPWIFILNLSFSISLYLLMVLLNLVEHVHEELLWILLPWAAKLRVVFTHNLYAFLFHLV